MKNGLVLEGGAMRGLFTAGVLDVLMENQVTFDAAIGVSAGAAFGCNLKSKQIGRTIRYNIRFCKDPRYCSIASWLLTGNLYGGKFDYERIPLELDKWDKETFVNNPMKFYVVATNARNGKALYHECKKGDEGDLRWIQGSASMPLASKPIKIHGFELLDGGISDSIPYNFFSNIGYEHSILVLTRPIIYRKKPFNSKFQKILEKGLQHYPAIYQRLLHRHEEYNRQVEEIMKLEEEGKVLVIRPQVELGIGAVCHNAKEMMRVYELGRLEGIKNLEKIKSFLYEN